MKIIFYPAAAASLLFVAACGQASTVQAAAEGDAAEAAEATAVEAVDTSAAISGVYESESEHAYIAFSYLHKGLSRPILRWGSWTGELDWNADDPASSSVSVTIEVASIDSGVERFDEHLKSADFFDADAFPQITFTSTSLTRTGPNTGTMTGDLTIKDTTKPVTLNVTLNGAGPEGDYYKVGFSARGSVKRSDFGVDKYVAFVGDEVDLIIETEFQMAKDQ